MNKKELIQGLHTFFGKHGRAPKKVEFNKANGLLSYSTYYRNFGSLTKAIEEAELPQNNSNNHSKVLTDEVLISTLKRFYIENNRSPKSLECCASHKYLQAYNTYINRFGSFKEALIIAEVEQTKTRPKKYSDTELLETLKNFYEKNNKAPQIKEFTKSNGLRSLDTYKKRFGSLTASLELANIPKNEIEKLISNIELIEAMQRFNKEKGRPPTQLECNNHEYLYSGDTYYKRFGSFTAALELAGLPTNIGGVSSAEFNLVASLREIYAGEIILNSRPLKGKEIDIIIPEHSLAIEYDGLYWHSESKGKTNKYHLNKTIEAKELGYTLVHIFESEWLNKKDIVMSRLGNMLGTSSRIYARKCSIVGITSKESKNFLDSNHIQGSVNCSVSLGLQYEGTLVALMTFSKARFTKTEWELVRYCNILNNSVVGGASRLFKHFLKTYNPESIVSYSDKRWNSGNLYNILKFEHSHDSKPNYWYFKGKKLESRISYQKHKLKDKLSIFDKDKTEYENMLLNGYDRIFDCGNRVYIWKKAGLARTPL